MHPHVEIWVVFFPLGSVCSQSSQVSTSLLAAAASEQRERERGGDREREGVRLGDAGGGRRGCIKTEEHTTAGETQEKKKNTTNLNLNTQLE